MLYSLEQGEFAADTIMMALAMRQPIPAVFSDPPELDFGLEIFLQAFHDVLSERPVSFGALVPIPRSKVRDWIIEKGITDPELIERLYFHVASLDTIFRQHAAAKAKEQQQQPESEYAAQPQRWNQEVR